MSEQLQSSAVNTRKSRIPFFKVGVLALIILLAGRWMWYSQAKAWEVSLNGEIVGVIDEAEREVLLAAIDSLTEELRAETALDIGVSSQVDFQFVLNTKKDDVESVKTGLLSNLEFGLRAAAIVVNGEEVVVLPTREEAESVLEELKVRFIRANSLEVEQVTFQEDVKIEDKYVSYSYLDDSIDRETALNILLHGSEKILQHTVTRGESFWSIASKYRLSVSVLQAANPNVRPEALQIGAKLSLKLDEPFVRVSTVETIKYNQSIPFNTTYVTDNSLWTWQSVVRTRGVPGTREVMAKVTSINGAEEDREILSTQVVKEPTAQVVARGTKSAPSQSTGTFVWPTTGRITSPFGPRWGGHHSGVDIGAPSGTPIKAADNGVVSFSGWNGGYGYMVRIEHGDGFTTLYAHASRLLVSQNQHVKKGDTIALVGNTGNSYGAHLHFEIHVNGRPVNPLNYFR